MRRGPEMQNPFAIAMQWPDDSRRYLVHLERPYFTAAIYETASAAWLLVSWAPASRQGDHGRIYRLAAHFCATQLDQQHVPLEFVERRHGHDLPKYLMAQTLSKNLFIVEPDHAAPLVQVRESLVADDRIKPKAKNVRFDIVTQWRLAEMRKYYRQYLERQHPAPIQKSSLVNLK